MNDSSLVRIDLGASDDDPAFSIVDDMLGKMGDTFEFRCQDELRQWFSKERAAQGFKSDGACLRHLMFVFCKGQQHADSLILLHLQRKGINVGNVARTTVPTVVQPASADMPN